MTPERYRTRRRALAAQRPGTVFIFPSAPTRVRNRTVEHAYRPDSQLVYLAGFTEPGAVLVVGEGGESVLYARERDPQFERWVGPIAGLEAAGAATGVERVRPLAELDRDLVGYLVEPVAVGWRFGLDERSDGRLLEALVTAWRRRRRRDDLVPSVVDPGPFVAALRRIKEPDEIECMRRAAGVTVAAHRAMAGALRAGETELGLAGRIEAEMRARGSEREAYGTIVATGERATCLHAGPTRRALREGELVLVDAGAELDFYASDLTRTLAVGTAPVAGARAALFAAVLDAQRAALSAVRPGATLADVHRAAREVLAAACRELGLPGEVERWAVHPTSHWVGLDVHDVGPYEVAGTPVPLEVGMAFSVEPGLYVDLDADEAPAELRGVGIRIEDTVVVAGNGAEVLTEAMPKTLDELRGLAVG